MAVGRISGPLLKANLLREGVNLAFETDLLYLDVVNGRVGIKTTSPSDDLTVNGTSRTTNLEATTQATISSFTISGNTIASSNGTINLTPAGVNPVIYQGKISVNNNLEITSNTITATSTNSNLDIATNGTGQVNINSNVWVNGNVHATGNITADGNITIGNADTDTVTFNADITSNIIPDVTNTYNLGSNPSTGGKAWANTYTQNLSATTVTSQNILVNGINLALPQGKIYYVATTGNDTKSGTHENDPFLTVKKALSVATSGDTVYIYPGTYQEIFPLTVPVGVTVRGAGIRSTKITPTTATRYNDAFLLNGETLVEELTVADFFSGGNFFTVTASSTGSTTINVGTAPYAHTYVSGGTVNISGTDYTITNAVYTHTTGVLVLTHTSGTATLGASVFVKNLTFSCNGGNRVFPDNGYAFRFATDFTVTSRSPYIRNLTVLTKGSVTSPTDPLGFDSADAGKGAYVDGAYALSTSKEASMLFHAVTFICPGINTINATNGVRIEWLNSFTYYADKALYFFSSNDGFANQGLTRLRINTKSGAWNVGNTVTYYDTDGTTVLASGTIASLDGDYVNLTGYRQGFETLTDRAGKTLYVNGNAKLSVTEKKFGSASLVLDGTGDFVSAASQPDFGFGKVNRPAKTITVSGDAAISSTQSKFGGSSIAFDGTGDKITVASSSDFAFGTGDFTAEAWIYRNSTSGSHCIFDFRSASAGNNGILLFTSNTLQYFVNGSVRISVAVTGTGNVWTHVALVRSAGTTTTYVNGVAVGTPYVDGYSYVASSVTIGSYYTNTAYFNGYIDEARVSDNARYTGTFTPSTTAFAHDQNSVLLVHGDTNISDDAGSQTAGLFTIEGWVYRTTSGSYQTIFDMRTTATDVAPAIGIDSLNRLYYYLNGSIVIQGTNQVPLNTWAHVSISKSYNSLKMFLNGVQEGSTYTDTTDYPARPLRIGADYNSLYGFTGYIDEVRISRGVSRYNSTFTAPTTSFLSDASTVLLLHFNGTNNSTTIFDDGITYQDLRTSAGGTATLINFADYSDFGAEIRSIGSASVYGNYGAYGTGQGVIAYLISQNFAYIGAGKKSTNDPTDRIAANEVIEINGAQIHYTSVDNEGNFKVGDSFYVNQKTGEVLFNGNTTNITSATGVTFTDGVNSTIVTPTDITTGNIRISGNTIESLAGNVNVTSASGAINLQNNTYVTGNLDVTGDVTIGGNIQIGDQTTDTISFVAGINSNLIPATTATYDIGTSSLRWNNGFLSRIEIDGVVIDNNTISTTLNNDDLSLIANGTGRIYIPSNNVQIDQNLTVTQNFTVTTGTTYLKGTSITGTLTQNGAINQTGNLTTSGNTSVTGNITGTGYLRLPQIEITGNTISTRTAGTDLNLEANGTGNVVIEGIKVNNNVIQSIAADSDITLQPQGTGLVIIDSNQSLKIPVGTTAERPTGSNGMIRYNTNLSRYEGYSGSYWIALGGVQDVDGNTKITAELTPGANDNTLRFYADNNLMVTIDSTKLFAERLQTTSLDFTGNTISAINPNTDIVMSTSGTGAVRIGNLKFNNNTITNVVNNAVTEFVETGTGYVKIAGVNGVVIPVGDTLNDRPSIYAQTGMIRFNTDGLYVEVFNGTTWGSVAGSQSGVTTVEATDIGVIAALTFG